ncbi:hypothetical protein BU25DRAFT_457084 [Macroventuria anomochaeta]|uniref:Uncharacterized protein n=1 Tax=Macroventuria anomochaeta TaxID=301207 RepID=A0ACB6S584_9PLEO|nr:uncharacterized protein BU25DRAFT_457084 [Macroventuria anomochaeta]KAF2629420.1 hypothetical protein BU25DRAFT_457084 [Macroventuria anomochaeta]
MSAPPSWSLPTPKINSALPVRPFGHTNPTRPWKIVADYLKDIFAKHPHRVSFNTTDERVRKNPETGKWDMTLRQSDHAKHFRSRDAYVDKSVAVVGGSVSASDFVLDTYTSVRGPLIVAQCGENANSALDNVWKLPAVGKKLMFSRFTFDNGGTVKSSDGSRVSGADVVVVYFATDYRLSYPFLEPDPVTSRNRLAGFYQHAFNIANLSLAVVGQIRAALSFRTYEYQAVVVARAIVGRGTLPATAEQKKKWEEDRVKRLGPTHISYTIVPDFEEYFNTLRAIAGPPAERSEAYELPKWEDE